MDFSKLNLGNMFNPTTKVTGTPPAAPAAQPQRDPNSPAAGLDVNNPGADPQKQLENLGDDPNKKKVSSPLDEFNDLFKIDPNKKPTEDPTKKPLLNLDAKKIAEAVSKLDFTQGMDVAAAQKALAGDIGEFGKVINQVAQKAYLASFNSLTGIMEQAFASNNDRFGSTLMTRFRDFQINSTDSQNPVFKHPTVKPVIASLKAMFSQQDPNLSPAEVQSKAEQYFLSMNKALNSLETEGGDDDPTKAGAPKEPDWEKFVAS